MSDRVSGDGLDDFDEESNGSFGTDDSVRDGDGDLFGDNLYAALNVSESASTEEIRDAYKKLGRLFHPDKHTDPRAKEAASRRFQRIQYASEDSVKRDIYDTFGEEGLKTKWDVGDKYKSVDELRREFEKQARTRREEDVDSLVRSKGDITATCNLQPLFLDYSQTVYKQGKLYQLHDPGLSAKIRLCDITAFSARHSFSIPIRLPSLLGGEPVKEATEKGEAAPDESEENEQEGNSVLAISAQCANKAGSSGNNMVAMVKHTFSQNFSSELGCVLVKPRSMFTKFLWSPTPDVSVTGQATVSSLTMPPVLSVNAARKITVLGSATVSYKTGVWALGPWGSQIPTERRGLDSQFAIGWQQMPRKGTPGDPILSGQLMTGLLASGAAAEYSRIIYGSGDRAVRATIRGNCTTGGSTVSVGATRKYGEHTRMGLFATATVPTAGLSLRVNWARLGQKISLPISLSNEYNATAVLWGVVVPITTLFVYELKVSRPYYRQQRRMRLMQRRKTQADSLMRQKQEAIETVRLIQDSVERKQRTEEETGGLVIVEASYGIPRGHHSGVFENGEESMIDVRIAVASLIHDGQLSIAPNFTKAVLPGFYDPCYGVRNKQLRVKYRFRNKMHQVNVNDRAALAIPQRSMRDEYIERRLMDPAHEMQS